MTDILREIIKQAVSELLNREYTLIRKNAHEQAICNRLARYVEVAKDNHGLKQYYVDVEYDRHGERRKTIYNVKTGVPINIVSDLLLHSRGEQEIDNLIAVEMKKASGKAKDKQSDRERLQALTTTRPNDAPPGHVWDYMVGYYLEVDVKNASLLVEEYEAGKLTQSTTLAFAVRELR
jgi:hypothetical protein